jgi:hypothetical protein
MSRVISSTVTCVIVDSFMIVVPFSPGALVGVPPLLRTPLPRPDTASRKFCRGSSASRLSAIRQRDGFGATALRLLMRAQGGRGLGPDGQRTP